MARRTVVEVQCSRCDRKELVEEHVAATGALTPPKAIIIKMSDGTTVEFDDLCGPCKAAVGTHVAAIGKKIEGVSPERKKGGKVTLEELGFGEESPKQEQVAKKKDPTKSGPSSA